MGGTLSHINTIGVFPAFQSYQIHVIPILFRDPNMQKYLNKLGENNKLHCMEKSHDYAMFMLSHVGS